MAEEANKKAEITLYWLEKSRSHRILWMLEELNIPYNLKTFKRGPDMLAQADLKAVHPLGKSPVLGVKGEGQTEETKIAESGAIVEYLADYFGQHLIPKKFQEGKEGLIGGESDEWMRYRFFMHYAEGSLMSMLVLSLIMMQVRDAPVPFFIKPVTKGIYNQINSKFLSKSMATHFNFVEAQLKSSGGDYLCGKNLTGADILMVFPLEAAQGRAGITKESHPEIHKYVERLTSREAYKKAIEKIKKETGEYNASL